jgi:hypothetical protein
MTMHDHRGSEDTDEIAVNPLFARDGEETIPRWRIPADEMLSDTAYLTYLDGMSGPIPRSSEPKTAFHH